MSKPARFQSATLTSRPTGRRVVEVYNPKLNRRLQCFGESAFEQWVRREADPTVESCCERPAWRHAAPRCVEARRRATISGIAGNACDVAITAWCIRSAPTNAARCMATCWKSPVAFAASRRPTDAEAVDTCTAPRSPLRCRTSAHSTRRHASSSRGRDRPISRIYDRIDMTLTVRIDVDFRRERSGKFSFL